MLAAALARWSLQDAKNQFSELVRRVLSEGPQLVTRSGQDVVVVVPASEYERLTTPRQSLLTFLQASPLADIELDFNRPRDAGRPIEI
jgi:prevent-host-death family protein